MTDTKQMSESIPIYMILALSGGCMDAYSYLNRGRVFANAQTGNMLLFGVNCADRNISDALRYLWPVLAFAAGIMLSDLIRYKIQPQRLHWRQFSVILEMAVLFLVCWLPQDLNSPANVLTSFVCGLQVESFRSVHGNAMATTMCIGNLRSGTYYLGQYFRNRNAAWIRKAALYYGMILFFVLGAVAESFLIRLFAEKALLLSVSLLMMAFLLMLSHPDAPSPRRS